MRKSRMLAALTALLLALAGPAGAGVLPNKAKPTAPPPPTVGKLLWLAGRWRQEISGRVIDEEWMEPAGGVMIGMSRTLAKGRVVGYGFLQIREGPGGDLFFVAQPGGEPAGTYQMSTLTETMVVFENTEHDFPQKITYALQPDGRLQVMIEGVGKEGEAKATEFSYRKLQP